MLLLELPWLFSATQIPPPPPAGSIDPFVGWLIAVVIGALIAAIAALWKENQRKDQWIERLLSAELENARANAKGVSLLEEEKRRAK